MGILDGYQPNIAQIAAVLGVNVQWLPKKWMQPYTFGLLFEKIEQRQQQESIWAQCWQVEIRQAIKELRLYLDKLRKKCDRISQYDSMNLLHPSLQNFINLQAELLIPS